jgi:hypothetical protein
VLQRKYRLILVSTSRRYLSGKGYLVVVFKYLRGAYEILVLSAYNRNRTSRTSADEVSELHKVYEYCIVKNVR